MQQQNFGFTSKLIGDLEVEIGGPTRGDTFIDHDYDGASHELWIGNVYIIFEAPKRRPIKRLIALATAMVVLFSVRGYSVFWGTWGGS